MVTAMGTNIKATVLMENQHFFELEFFLTGRKLRLKTQQLMPQL